MDTNPITLDEEILEDVETFTYLSNIIDKQGGSDLWQMCRCGLERQGQHFYN
uniref:SJCHGC03052 protein n=1 Tax=Schistosoma japonicum TaxID=6182 RepID=Q3MJW0_SCHJA|nr:SJCHGC03052 protein [Schistosoma japonicum]